jgi:hypothetical protein
VKAVADGTVANVTPTKAKNHVMEVFISIPLVEKQAHLNASPRL